jgi:hypothetical protein
MRRLPARVLLAALLLPLVPVAATEARPGATGRPAVLKPGGVARATLVRAPKAAAPPDAAADDARRLAAPRRTGRGPRVRARVTTTGYLDPETTHLRLAWNAEIEGVRPGESARVLVQRPSADVVLPPPGAGNRALVHAMRAATRWSTLADHAAAHVEKRADGRGLRPFVTGDSTVVDENPDRHGPGERTYDTIRARGKVLSENRAERALLLGAPVRVEVAESEQARHTIALVEPDDVEATGPHPRSGDPVVTRGPRLLGGFYPRFGGPADRHYASWMTKANLRVTPAFSVDGAPGRAELIGLAAFPVGAVVTVVNRTMQRNGEPGHTVTATVKNRTGSLKLVLPAPGPDGDYGIAVRTPGSAAASAARASFRLPDPESDEVAAHGIAYLAPSWAPAAGR